jgi:malonate decarboxylase epsilon subunit
MDRIASACFDQDYRWTETRRILVVNPIAFLFPGQGSQRAGMLARLREDPNNAALVDDAQTILGRDLGELDTADALAGTEAAQIALFIASVASARSLERGGIEAAFVAGHSVGAFAAATTAGVIDFRDALAVVALRGHAMAQARPSGFGMAAIVGVPQSTLQTWIDGGTARGSTLYLTNRNAARQFAVSGADADLDALVEFARSHGASKAMRLAVAVPSHSPLMAEVVPKLRQALKNIALKEPRAPYASNSTARLLRDSESIADDLAENVAHPVRWSEIMTALYERGARSFVEMQPGDVLTKLAQSSFDDVRAFSLETTSVTQLRDYLISSTLHR